MNQYNPKIRKKAKRMTRTALLLFLLATLAVGMIGQAPTVTAQASVTCVTIQPDTLDGKDAYIKQDNQDDNKGDDNELLVATESGKLHRALLQFDVAILPAGAVIDSATLDLYIDKVKDGDVTINVHKVTNSWNEEEVTWADRDQNAIIPWSTLGGDYNAAVVDSQFLAEDTEDVWTDWTVTTLVSDWLANPANNHGLILESPVTNPKTETTFKSSDNSSLSQHPKLEVCYTLAVTLEPDNSAQGEAGETSTYGHVVHHGDVTPEVVLLSAASTQGWTVRFYEDVNGDGDKDPEDTQITQTPLLGSNVDYPILVEIDVPGGAADGNYDITTVTASAQTSNVSESATNTTWVGVPPVADPVLDGRRDEAYTAHPNARVQDYCDVNGDVLARTMSTFDVGLTDDVFVVLEMDLSHVDNTYGNNVNASWGGDSTSLGALKGSDAGQVILTNGDGTVIYDVTADYVEDGMLTPSGYGSAGVLGGQGSIDVGNAADVEIESSIGYNLNRFCTSDSSCVVNGVDLFEDSPLEDGYYTPLDATFNDWEYVYLYEYRFDAAAFGPSGFGDVTIDYVHVSPNKTGSNLIEVDPCTGSIGDRVWNDANRNQQQDGEPGLNGVMVQLYLDTGDDLFDPNVDQQVGSQFTAGDGDYGFTGLGPGTYFVNVADSSLPTGFELTTNNNPTDAILLGNGQNYDEADFGYAATPELAIEKTLTSAEPAFVGEEVTFNIRVTNIGDTTITVLPLEDIYDPTALQYLGATPASSSNGSGLIEWDDLTTGPGGDLAPTEFIDVEVRFQVLATALNPRLAPRQAVAGMGAPLASVNNAQTGQSLANVTRPFADIFTSIDGVDGTDAIETTCDCDGGITQLTIIYRDPGGHPLVDIVVDSDKASPTNFTNIADGDAFTTNAAPGESKLSSNTPFIISDAGTGNEFLTAEIHTSCSNPIYPGQIWDTALEIAIIVPVDGWGSCQLGSIGDRVFEDLDGSGLPDDNGEPGLNNVDVALHGGHCPALPETLISTIATAGNGDYGFADLPPGAYCINVDQSTAPANYELTTANAPLDVPLAEGEDFDMADFGFQLAGTASIGDRVFYDVDGSGLPDDGSEPGLNGVTVDLYEGVVCNGVPYRTQITSGNGDYDFTQLPAGDYCVNVDENTLPPGLTLTTANEPMFGGLADGEDFDVADFGYRAEAQDGTCDVAAVDGAVDEHNSIPAAVNDSACVTISAYGSIGNQVWVETDGNGEFDLADGDVVAPNVTVDLYKDGVYQDTETTNAGGQYTFDTLVAGTYTVTVSDNNGVLTAFEPTSDGPIPGADNNSQAQPYQVDLAAGEDNVTADFGYTDGGGGSSEDGDVGDLVWHDKNGDGVYQPFGPDNIPGNSDDEPGIDGVTVALCPAGISYPGIGCLTRVTSGGGNYLFTLVALASDLEVTIVSGLPAGLVHSTLGTPDVSGQNQSLPYPVLLTPTEPFVDSADFGFVAGTADYTIEKTLTSGNPVRTGELVIFNVRIQNAGSAVLTSVPLEDTYDKDYLTFAGADPEPVSNLDDGTINWGDLTAAAPHGIGADLAPGEFVDVIVEFVAKLDTTLLPNSQTVNTATGTGVTAGPLTIADKSDTAVVSIFNPTGVVIVNRTVAEHDGIVTVAWETTDESQLVAFNIYRTNDADERIKVNDQPIAAEQSGQPSGRSYAYDDATLDGSGSYHYELELLTVEGNATFVDMGVVDGAVNIFLPVITH